MTAYPALVQLFRLLGRADTLAALGVAQEPDPGELSAWQRDRLAELVELRLERVALELVEEAAASDDVTSRAAGLAFVRERVAAFADLLRDDQAEQLRAAAAALVESWERS